MSGTRLHAIVYDGGAGAVAWTGRFHDTVLDVDCTFVSSADGDTRCAPLALTDTTWFGDAACSEQVALLDSTRPTSMAAYHSTFVHQSCFASLQPNVRLTSVQRSDLANARAASTVYVLGPAGVCTPMALEAQIATVTDVPLSTLVRGTLSSRGDGLFDVYQATGEDGSSQVTTFGDSVHRWSCDRFEEDDLRCLPIDVASRGGTTGAYFSNASCGNQVAYLSPTCAPPLAVLAADRSRLDLYEIGTVTSGFREISAGSCMPSDDPDRVYWLVGAPISDDVIPTFVEHPTGTGRLQARLLATSAHGSGVVVRAPPFFDRERAVACAPATLHGTLRCVDAVTASPGGYLDATCTTIVVGYARAAGRPALALCSDGGCSALGDVVDGPFFQRVGPAGCTSFEPGPSTVYARVGDAIPDDAFAPVILSML